MPQTEKTAKPDLFPDRPLSPGEQERLRRENPHGTPYCLRCGKPVTGKKGRVCNRCLDQQRRAF